MPQSNKCNHICHVSNVYPKICVIIIIYCGYYDAVTAIGNYSSFSMENNFFVECIRKFCDQFIFLLYFLISFCEVAILELIFLRVEKLCENDMFKLVPVILVMLHISTRYIIYIYTLHIDVDRYCC